jgi:alpha-galactosidase
MPDKSHAGVAVSYAPKSSLRPGESLETFRTFVTVHQGDYFTALREYRKMMVAQGVRFPQSPASAFEPIWCAWGYRRGFKPEQIYGALPVVKKLNFGWVTLDDGWQTAEGDWYVNPQKFPAGDADMKRMVDRIHADGFKAQLWWAPMTANPERRSHQEASRAAAAQPGWIATQSYILERLLSLSGLTRGAARRCAFRY